MNIIILLLLIIIILKQIRYIKKLIIPTRKCCIEIITVLFGSSIIIGIIYFYAKTFTDYLMGILGVFIFVSIWIKQGISLEGFISMYGYKEIILWKEIEKVKIIKSKNIKIELSGNFMEQSFNFKKSDYSKIINILNEKLSKKSQLQEIIN